MTETTIEAAKQSTFNGQRIIARETAQSGNDGEAQLARARKLVQQVTGVAIARTARDEATRLPNMADVVLEAALLFARQIGQEAEFKAELAIYRV